MFIGSSLNTFSVCTLKDNKDLKRLKRCIILSYILVYVLKVGIALKKLAKNLRYLIDLSIKYGMYMRSWITSLIKNYTES